VEYIRIFTPQATINAIQPEVKIVSKQRQVHAQLRLNSISAESFFSLMEVKKGSASRVGVAWCMTIFMKMSVHLLCKNGLLIDFVIHFC